VNEQRDTPEQVDQLLAAGWTRTAELDGIGFWNAPLTGFAVSGAANALAYQAALDEAQQQQEAASQ
jgi:hypothetical protein